MKKKNIAAAEIGAIALCCTAALTTISRKKEAEGKNPEKMLSYALCPVCGSVITKGAGTCRVCGCFYHPCPSCGQMMKDSACFCKNCGFENEKTRFKTVQGVRRRITKREPDPKMEVTHEYCSCGTPFAFEAKYCQFCGKVRPKPGESYIRKDLPT